MNITLALETQDIVIICMAVVLCKFLGVYRAICVTREEYEQESRNV